MKKRGLIASLVMLLCVLVVGLVLPSGDAKAYFSSSKDKNKQCFAMQWLGEQETGDTGKEEESNGQSSNIYYKALATRTFCTNDLDKPTKITRSKSVNIDGALEVGSPETGTWNGDAPSGGFTINTTSDGKGIKVTLYNGKAPKESKTFKLSDSDYGNDFEKLTQAVYDYLPNDPQGAKGLGEITMKFSKYKENQKLTTRVLNKMSAEAEKEKYGTTNNDPTSDCYAGSGALGWILCPVISAASKIGEDLWNDIIEYHLKIPAQAVFEEGGGVEQTWGVVRNIANIVFIILFLFVIFSQLTGVGIDNYGIKKIMPKLIVVAVLMNLSYVICELAVDVSNILGVSLNNLFSDIAYDIDVGEAMGVGAVAVGGLLEMVLGGGGVLLFQFLKAGSLKAAAGAIGLAAIGIVLIVVVAILVLYAILTIREAGIILLTVLSPVALVCYMLPNTEKYYKKWFDIFKALLVVYPICGAMVGAGQLAGAVLSTVDSAGMKVSAMIVQVLPFFLIPVVLKNSLSLLGNAGAKISSFGMRMGRRASSGVQNAVKNTDRYKDWSQRAKDDTMLSRAGRTQQRLQDRIRNGTATAGERRRFARAANIERNIMKTRSDENVVVADAMYANEGLDQLLGRWDTAFRENNGTELSALTNLMDRRYGAAAAGKIGERLSRVQGVANNENYQASMQTLRQTMDNNTNFAGNMRNKASDAFQMIQDAGRKRNNETGEMEYADLGYFSEHNGVSTNLKDWSTQSAATLQRAISSGALTEEDVNALLNSTDPSIQSGIQSDKSKRDVLQAAINRQDSVGETGPRPAGEVARMYREREAARANNNQPTSAPTNPPRQNARPVNPVPSGFTERDSGLVVPHDIHRR